MQDTIWEREYQSPQLVTKDEKPQKDTLRFLKFLKKEEKIELHGLRVLDLGCGAGRNSNYLAGLGNNVSGFEISRTALSLAKSRAKDAGVEVDYLLQNMGERYPFAKETFDILLDVTSSNSLNEKEREVYLLETFRVLKNGGYFFVKALCKDGDKNAKELLKKFTGGELEKYINKDMWIIDRVCNEKDLKNAYLKYFQIIHLEKKTSYTRFKNQSYKRNFWLAYLKKNSF
jgi:SAM-dependent methyltransferase